MALLRNKMDENEMMERERPRKEDIRGSYYRDTTAIIHSSPFRRLKHKTQVFYAPSNDHICTRMEHVLHVASIASTICRPLGLDTELAWAIDFLSNNGKGLNLTYAVRDGIVSHNGESLNKRLVPTFKKKDMKSIVSRVGLVPATYEGVVVRFSDTIAYLGRDFEDASRLGIVDGRDLPEIVKTRLGTTNSQIITALVNDLIEGADEENGIGFSDYVFEAVKAFSDFNYQYIYRSKIMNGYTEYFSRLINLILNYLEKLYSSFGLEEKGYLEERNMLAAGFYSHMKEMYPIYMEKEGSDKRMIMDYIAGMTDNFCLDCANEILKPEHLNDEINQSQTGKWFDVRRS